LTKPTKLRKQSKLHNVDIRVLEGLALYDARNQTKLATQLKMPRETLRHRIKRLRSNFSLYLQGNVYHTNIGLRKVMVLAESKPGYEELLYQCLKSNDYWLYVSQCIGAPKCVATYGIPAEKGREFEEFMSKLGELDQIYDVNFFWCTSIHTVNTTSTWFDKTSEEWIFPWDSWVKEVQASRGELPYPLKEPEAYVQKADWIDIMILKELEKNCTIKLEAIAKMLNMSSQRVRYHLENHVIKEQMFEGPQILADHYKGLSPNTYFFIFTFKNHQNFAKFTHSLLNKPFPRAMGKTYGKNQLFVRIYLPRQQLRNFIETLSRLVRIRFLETYEYVIEDLTRTQRQTISYEFFKDNNWEYDDKKYLEKLQSTVKQFIISS